MLSPVFSPFPELRTERLLLRKITMDDAPAVFELRSNEQVMKYIARPLNETIEDAKKWVRLVMDALEKNEGITWCICLKEQPAVHVGTIGFWRMQKENHRAEIGYMLHPSLHGKGIAYEAMQVVMHYGFDVMQLHSVEAHVDPDNIASIRLLQKAEFVREALFKENYFFNGTFLDTAVYSKIKKVTVSRHSEAL